jgi:hypothetical protein
MQKVDTTEKQNIPAPQSLSSMELQDARQVINTLLLAWKNYGLYPEDHTSSIQSFEKVAAAFNIFFTTHDDLRLTVEKDRLLCASEPIYEISSEASSEDIITLLYRDGIKWIEFQQGLTLGEIASFFKIAYRYRMFAEETEGDIVTALMDAELEHIDFKAVDIFWQEMLLMDFAKLPPPPQFKETTDDIEADESQPEKAADRTDQDKSQLQESSDYKGTSVKSIADPSIDVARLELSKADYEVLQQMVQEEEGWNITVDLFEVLLIILKSQSEPEKFRAVLNFILEEVIETFKLEKFNLLLKLFQSLRKLLPAEPSADQTWIQSDIDRFFQNLSRPETFQLISEKLLTLHETDIEKLKDLHRILFYFSPKVIPFLMPVIIQRSSPDIQKMVSEVIVHMGKSDIRPLEKIAEQHDAEMGDKLLLILNQLQGDRINDIFFKMCKHPSDMVRRKAIKELLDREPQYAQKLFSLIDDPSREIRSIIFAAFAKQKSSALENMLLNYLRGNAARKDPAHILVCYKALGRCGSNNAVPFLSRILLSQGWNRFLGSGKPVFREGAATALSLLQTPEAMNVLQKASKSRFRVIRNALDKIKTTTASGEKSND